MLSLLKYLQKATIIKSSKAEQSTLNINKVLSWPSSLQKHLGIHSNLFPKPQNSPLAYALGSHQVQCNIPTFEALLRKNMYLFLERWRKSNNVWLRALMQSGCLYSSLFFEHYNRILLCDWVLGHCSVCLFEGVSCHNAFVLYLAPTGLGISVLQCSAVVLYNTCYGLANNSVKNMPVTTGSASNAVVKRSVLAVFINLHRTESVCLYCGLRVCWQKCIHS